MSLILIKYYVFTSFPVISNMKTCTNLQITKYLIDLLGTSYSLCDFNTILYCDYVIVISRKHINTHNKIMKNV